MSRWKSVIRGTIGMGLTFAAVAGVFSSVLAALGAGGGLVLAGLLVAATWQEWPNGNAIVPFTFLPLLGAGAATASLLLARRAGPALTSGEESRSLGQGEVVGPPSSAM